MEEQRKFSIANEVRFYIIFALASFLLVKGFFVPPVGEIAKTVLYASAGLTTLAACMVGVDVKGIIREIRLLKKENVKEIEDREEK